MTWEVRMNYKRYDPQEPVCICSRHSCICENDNVSEVEGEYLKIEELVVKGCSDDKRTCPFYSTEYSGPQDGDHHQCGITEEYIYYTEELKCPFEDIRKTI
jgi:hypothetical protein